MLLGSHAQEFKGVLIGMDQTISSRKLCFAGVLTNPFFQLLDALNDALDHLDNYPRIRLALLAFESRAALAKNSS